MLVIGAETKRPFKEPRSNLSILQHLVPDLAKAAVESELVPSLASVISIDNSGGEVDLSPFRSITPWDQVVEDGGHYGGLETEPLDPNETVNIQFTSGTTSMPKAACLSHRNILNNGRSIGDRMLLTEKDVVCSPPPLFQYVKTAPSSSAT